jgi:hypothetical protein
MRAHAALVCLFCVMPSAFAQQRDQTDAVGCSTSRSGGNDLNTSLAREGGLLPLLAANERSGNAGLAQPATCGHSRSSTTDRTHSARTQTIATRVEPRRLCVINHKAADARYSMAQLKH